jgi:hypothetical protein
LKIQFNDTFLNQSCLDVLQIRFFTLNVVDKRK